MRSAHDPSHSIKVRAAMFHLPFAVRPESSVSFGGFEFRAGLTFVASRGSSAPCGHANTAPRRAIGRAAPAVRTGPRVYSKRFPMIDGGAYCSISCVFKV